MQKEGLKSSPLSPLAATLLDHSFAGLVPHEQWGRAEQKPTRFLKRTDPRSAGTATVFRGRACRSPTSGARQRAEGCRRPSEWGPSVPRVVEHAAARMAVCQH